MPRALLILLLVLSSSACPSPSSQRNAQTTRDAAAAANATNKSRTSLPRAPDISADRTRSEGAGQFNQYKFRYQRAGNQTTATFASPRLPWRDAVVVAAAREIIIAAYNDRSENFPRPVTWNYEGASVNAIKLEGDDYEYVFLPIRDEAAKEGTKQVSSIVCWRLNKGTVR